MEAVVIAEIGDDPIEFPGQHRHRNSASGMDRSGCRAGWQVRGLAHLRPHHLDEMAELR
jgi:hypothetical protein